MSLFMRDEGKNTLVNFCHQGFWDTGVIQAFPSGEDLSLRCLVEIL